MDRYCEALGRIGGVLEGTGNHWVSTGSTRSALGRTGIHWDKWDLPWEALDRHWEALGQHRDYWEPLGQHREVTGSTKQLTYKGCTLDTKLTWV